MTWWERAECTGQTVQCSRGLCGPDSTGCVLSLMCGNKQKRLTNRHCSMNPVKPTLWWRKWFCAQTVLSEKLCARLTVFLKMVFSGANRVAEALHPTAGAKIFITTMKNLFRAEKHIRFWIKRESQLNFIPKIRNELNSENSQRLIYSLLRMLGNGNLKVTAIIWSPPIE